ncbi:hypothetical protein EVA_18471, partial [gut metagenome]
PEGFNGRVRLMAVGAARDAEGNTETPTRLGQAAATVVVREPVVLTGALPRFVTPGDRFEAAVTLTPSVAGRGTMTLAAPATGEAKSFEAPAETDTTLTWTLQAPTVPGTTPYRFEGTFNEKPLQKTLSVGVRPATLRRTVTRWGLLPDTKTWTLDNLPAMSAVEADATLTLSAAPLPLIRGLADLTARSEARGT